MTAIGRQEGFSLFDFTVAIAIASLLLPVLAGIIYMLQLLPDRSESDVKAQKDIPADRPVDQRGRQRLR